MKLGKGADRGRERERETYWQRRRQPKLAANYDISGLSQAPSLLISEVFLVMHYCFDPTAASHKNA